MSFPKNIWGLYDAGNSVLIICASVFFIPEIVKNTSINLVQLNIVFAAVFCLLIVSAVQISKRIEVGLMTNHLLVVSVLFCVSIIGLMLVYIYGYSSLLILFLLGLTLFLYQVSRVVHSAYFSNYCNHDSIVSNSALGASYNWGGSVVGLCLGVGAFSFGFNATSVLVVALFIFISLAVLTWRRLLRYEVTVNIASSRLELTTNSIWPVLKRIAPLLFSIFLFLDVLGTLQKNIPTIFQSIYLIDPETAGGYFLVILISASFLSFLISRFPILLFLNRIYVYGFVALSLCLSLVLIHNFGFYILGCFFAGISYGVFESVSRADIVLKSPKESLTLPIAIYSILERSSTIFGSIIWVVISIKFPGRLDLQYFSLAFLLLIGFVVFKATLDHKKV